MHNEELPVEQMEEGVLFTSKNAQSILSDAVYGKLRMLLKMVGNTSGQERVRLALQNVQKQLMESIALLCAEQVRFDTDGMIEADETTPLDCAQRLLETLPLYHMLAGSSFYASTLRERHAALERLQFPAIAEWRERAARMVEGVLDDLLAQKNANVWLSKYRREKKR